MFPLQRRRRFLRLEAPIKVTVLADNKEIEANISDISASGCKLVFDSNTINTVDLEKIVINFSIKDNLFECNAEKVREFGYSFIDMTEEETIALNNAILQEYFKDTPTLIP